MTRYGKAQSVTVRQDGRAVLATVVIKDAMDISKHYLGAHYRYVSPASLARLARAINSLQMQVTIDEYGVPTWTRRGDA